MLRITSPVLMFVLAGAISTLASAQDMSGWSDKTLCRLMQSKPDVPAYVEEAVSRSLSCDTSKDSSSVLSQPNQLSVAQSQLQQITIPEQWWWLAIGNCSTWRLSLYVENGPIGTTCLVREAPMATVLM